MSITDSRKEELSKTFQQALKKYNVALLENTELESLKKLYVELRELKWKMLEFGYPSQYHTNMALV